MSPSPKRSPRPSVKFDFDTDFSDTASIKVVGVGGAGGNAVGRMIEAGLAGVDFINVNTDAQVLSESNAIHRLQIGRKLTKGLGSGGNPQIGQRAMEEDEDSLAELLRGADMVFVTAGMGGGTGTGAAPVVARVARASGALTVGVVTKPFLFEQRKRMAVAEEGLEAMREQVDTLITIPNQRLLEVVDPGTAFIEAFRVADDVLLQATRGISDLITVTGMINLDFADVKSIMAGMGPALMGTGEAEGESRAAEAARQAISCPLLEDLDIAGAEGVLINITGDESMTLHEITEATEIVTEAVGDQANVIFGTVLDKGLKGAMRITVIATGFGEGRRMPEAQREARQQELMGYPEPERAMAAAAAAAPAPEAAPAHESVPEPVPAPEAVAVAEPTASAEPSLEAVEVVEIQSEAASDAPVPERESEEVVPLLREEADEMKREAGIGFRPANAQSETDWEVPTFLRKQND